MHPGAFFHPETHLVSFGLVRCLCWTIENANFGTALELNAEIRDILSLEDSDRGWEISGTLHITYTDESVKQASLLPQLEARGVAISWHKKADRRTA